MDTPGFGDTRSYECGAQLIATLKNTFEDDEELKHGKFPTIVLIVANFTDNRFEGENSSFVRMLKGLTSMKEKIFDEHNSNAVLLLTHFKGLSPKVQKHWENRRQCFVSVFRQVTGLPIVAVLAENRADDYELPKTNGYYDVSDKEFYPYNLFVAIQRLACKSGDIIGEAIVRTAFKDITRSKIVPKEIELLSSGNKTCDRGNENHGSNYAQYLTNGTNEKIG